MTHILTYISNVTVTLCFWWIVFSFNAEQYQLLSRTHGHDRLIMYRFRGNIVSLNWQKNPFISEHENNCQFTVNFFLESHKSKRLKLKISLHFFCNWMTDVILPIKNWTWDLRGIDKENMYVIYMVLDFDNTKEDIKF